MSEKDKVEKARKQLIIIGVACVAIMVFALWLVSLNNTFKRNEKKYNPTLEPFNFQLK